jgi:hypothetical protein
MKEYRAAQRSVFSAFEALQFLSFCFSRSVEHAYAFGAVPNWHPRDQRRLSDDRTRKSARRFRKSAGPFFTRALRTSASRRAPLKRCGKVQTAQL